MRGRLPGIVSAALVAIGLLAVPANAGPIIPNGRAIDFSSQSFPGGVNHVGGTISFTQGIGNSLDVSGAPMVQLTGGTHGPSPTGRYAIQAGFLNFVTGGCFSGCTKIVAGQEGPNFNDGGSLVVSGAIPSLGINASTDLIEGFFTNFGHTGIPATHATLRTSGSGGLFGYLDITSINPNIVDMLHLLGASGKGHLTEMFFALDFATGTHTWSGSIKSSDLLIVPVPEPASLVLLGSAFLFGGVFLRRKLTAWAQQPAKWGSC